MEPKTIKEVLALIAERPANAELYQVLGRLYLKARQPEKARAAYDEALALAPDDPWTHLYLGNWYYASGRLRDALDWFEKAAELMPDEGIVYTCQGDIYREQGQNDLAEEAYRTAARLTPEDEFVQRRLAEWYEFRYGEGESE